jgi:serine/threonine-protein kinase
LKELRALYDTGRHREALARAIALRPEAEATGYTPILAELLEATGRNQINIADSEVAEATLYEALIRAEAGGDDITLAKVATHLAYVTGYCQGRHQDGERWARFANAVLDRQGPGHAQLRAWALQNEAALYVEEGDFRRARELFERAVVLKEGALGADHPDVAVSLSGLGIVLTELGDPQKGLELEDRAVRIIAKRAGAFGWVFSNRGESLRRLGRYAEARADFERSLGLQQSDRDLAYPLTGLGEIDIAGGNPTAAVPLLERALRIRKEKEPDATYVATTEFALARALWESGGDRPRARALARSAREVYLTRRRPEKVGEVDVWLAAHVGSHH